MPFTSKFSAFGRAGVAYAEVEGAFEATGLVNVVEPNSESKEANSSSASGSSTSSRAGSACASRPSVTESTIPSATRATSISIRPVSCSLRRTAGGPVRRTATAPPPPVVVGPASGRRGAAAATAGSDRPVLLPARLRVRDQSGQSQLEEQEKLAVIGNFLTKYPKTTAEIEGHTDDVGTNAANQRLSERRANAVVSYLVRDLKFDRSRLTPVGYGETRPIADNSTDEGKRATAASAPSSTVLPISRGCRSARRARPWRWRSSSMRGMPASDRVSQRVAGAGRFPQSQSRVTATVEGQPAICRHPEEAMKISQRRAQNVVNIWWITSASNARG